MKRTSKQNRRYKLHQRIKSALRYSAVKKCVFLLPEELDLIEKTQRRAVFELRDKFGYNLQTEIR